MLLFSESPGVGVRVPAFGGCDFGWGVEAQVDEAFENDGPEPDWCSLLLPTSADVLGDGTESTSVAGAGAAADSFERRSSCANRLSIVETAGSVPLSWPNSCASGDVLSVVETQVEDFVQ